MKGGKRSMKGGRKSMKGGRKSMKRGRRNMRLDAQRQYVVIGTLALRLSCFFFIVIFDVSRAAAPKGAMSLLSGLVTHEDWLHLSGA